MRQLLQPQVSLIISYPPLSFSPFVQILYNLRNQYWVTLSKRGGMGRVFPGLAGLLQGVCRGQSPREIPRSSPASPSKTSSILNLLLGFTFYIKYDMLVIFLIFFQILMFEEQITCLCRGHDYEIYEVKQGFAMLVLGWVTAWCKHAMCRSFPAGSIGLEL